MTSKDTGHQKRFGRGFIQRVGELFSASVYMPCTRYTRIPSKPQVVKRRARGRGVEVTQKVVFGEAQQVEALLATSATRTTIHTSVVEREHLSWRAHNRRLTRKTIACSKALPWWEQQLWLALAS